MAQASSVQIRSATDLDVPRLAAALARTFASDPMFAWLCPDVERFGRLAPAALGAQIAQRYLRRGVVDVAQVDEEIVGGILWRVLDSSRHDGKAVNAWPWLRLVGRHSRRLTQSNRMLGRLHPTGAHIYIDTIGLVPGAQRHGIATGLLRPCLREADRGGFPVFLESTSPASLYVYERFGFEPHVLVELPHGPNVWTMIREPRPVQ